MRPSLPTVPFRATVTTDWEIRCARSNPLHVQRGHMFTGSDRNGYEPVDDSEAFARWLNRRYAPRNTAGQIVSPRDTLLF